MGGAAGIQEDTDNGSAKPFLAPTALVAATARLGARARIWAYAEVGARASLGDDCIVGRGSYIDHDVKIGASCKIQNYALVYFPAVVGSGVFIGPAASLTNDRYPRAINPDGTLKTREDWEPKGVTVEDGASIGAHAVVLGGVNLGQWATVSAGAVVTRSIRPYALVAGVPARQIGWVGRSGRRLEAHSKGLLVDPLTGDLFQELGDEIVKVP